MYRQYFSHCLPQYPCQPYFNPYNSFHRTYPPVDTQIFSASVQNIRLLMEQGRHLLDKLAESAFETKIMTAAQQGKHQEVDQLIQSIGLKIPIETKYTPSGVNFILRTPSTTNDPFNCCSLTIGMKWGR